MPFRLLRNFTSGLGLKTLLSYLPPSIVVWVFFALYLHGLKVSHSDILVPMTLLGLDGIEIGQLAQALKSDINRFISEVRKI